MGRTRRPALGSCCSAQRQRHCVGGRRDPRHDASVDAPDPISDAHVSAELHADRASVRAHTVASVGATADNLRADAQDGAQTTFDDPPSLAVTPDAARARRARDAPTGSLKVERERVDGRVPANLRTRRLERSSRCGAQLGVGVRARSAILLDAICAVQRSAIAARGVVALRWPDLALGRRSLDAVRVGSHRGRERRALRL